VRHRRHRDARLVQKRPACGGTAPDPRVGRERGAVPGPQPWTADVSGTPASERSAAVLTALTEAGGSGNGNVLQIDLAMPVPRASYTDQLRGPQCTSADAAGFPIAALTPTADEVAFGWIDHALRFVLPNDRMKADVYVPPATRADIGRAKPAGGQGHGRAHPVERPARRWHGRCVLALRLRLVARRHVDLGRLASALCPGD
jgi:hypothetical protein